MKSRFAPLMALVAVAAIAVVFIFNSSQKPVAVLPNLPAPETQVAQVVAPTQGLVTYWKMDGGSPVSDSAGTGVTGTLIGSPSQNVGRVGDALAFNGNSGGVSASSVNLSGTNAVSVAFWLNASSLKSVIESTTNFNNSSTGFAIFVNDAQTCPAASMGVEIKGNNGYNVKCYTFPTSGWHHYVAIFDKSQGGSGEVSLYIDNSPVSADSQPKSSDNTNNFGTDSLYLMNRAGSTLFSSGTVDEFRVYSRALNSSDISNLYNYTGVTPPRIISDGEAVSVTVGTPLAFSVATPGNYKLVGLVNAPDKGANSLYVDIDNAATGDNLNYWDIPDAAGDQWRDVTWPGSAPKIFSINASSHTLRVTNRETGTVLKQIKFVRMDVVNPQTPVISNIQSLVGSDTATVSWSTDINSDTQLQYGLTSGYGSNTALNSTMSTSHQATITGLTPGTTYHYKARSANGNNIGYSQDMTITTTNVATVPVTVNKSGNGTGTITGTSGGNCGPTCTTMTINVPVGGSVTLNAAPSGGIPPSTFGGWTGACTNLVAIPCVLNNVTTAKTVNAAFNISVAFYPNETVNVTGSTATVYAAAGGGTSVGTQPVGALGRVTGVSTVLNGNAWWNIDFTSGADGYVNEQYLVLSNDSSNNLTVTLAGSGSGTVTSNPGGLTCTGTTCRLTTNNNASVTLTAAPNVGSAFSGWSGACTNTATTCSIVMTTDKAATATFLANSTKFSVGNAVKVVNSAINVRSTPNGATSLGTQAINAKGTVVAPTSGSFTNPTYAGGYWWWNIDYASGVDGWSFEDNLALDTVNPVYSLTINKAGAGTGNVTCAGTCPLTVTGGTIVSLTETPTNNSTFSGWTVSPTSAGNCGTAANCSVTINSATVVTAGFNPPSGGSCSTPTLGTWQPTQLSSVQTGAFRAEYDVTPNGAAVNDMVGLSTGPATQYADMAVIVLFNTNGVVQARDGAAYAGSFNYSSGVKYHVRVDVNIPAHTYSAYITAPGGTEVELGRNLAFRSEVATASSLGYWNAFAPTGVGNQTICNFATSPISTKFSMGTKVQASGAVTVRSGASQTAAVVGTQVSGTAGSIIGGSVYAEGAHWWNVDFTSGADGWVTEASLVNYVDTVAPTTPTGLNAPSAQIYATQITLNWIASTDYSGVTGYKIYRNGNQVSTSAATTYTDTGLSANTSYTYTVSAYDAVSNTSAQSAGLTVSTNNVQSPTVLIPSDRYVAWQPGVPGGIPTYPVSINVKDAPYSAKGDGSTNDTSAIQRALDAAPAGTAVYMPAGTYKVDGLLITKPVVLRGAGQANTTLTTAGDPWRYIKVEPINHAEGSKISSGNWLRGTRTFTASNASSLTPGTTLVMVQSLPSYVYNLGANGDGTWLGRNDPTNRVGQIVRVVSVSGTTVTVDRPAYIDYTNSPGYKIYAMMSRAGVEDFTIRRTENDNKSVGSDAGGANVYLSHCDSCWIKNVTSVNTGHSHFFLEIASRSEVRQSIADSTNNRYYHGSDHAYGYYMNDYNTDNLVIDNIARGNRHSVIFQGGVSGAVIAYNYTYGGYQDTAEFVNEDIGTHTAFPFANLFEGNYTGTMHHDNTLGNASWNLTFRGYILNDSSAITVSNKSGRTGFRVEKHNYYNSIVASIIGRPSDRGSTSAVSYSYGAHDTGNNGSVDPAVAGTVYNDYTYDYIGNRITYDTVTNPNHSIPPASMFLKTKPDFFGNLPWPPIDPTVAGPTWDPTSSDTGIKLPAKYRAEGRTVPQ